MRGGNAIARWVREREPRAIAALIGEFSRMIPGAEFDVAEQGRRNRLLVERIGKFGDWHEATLADEEVGAARVADLRISRPGRCRIPVEDRSGQGQIASWRNPQSGAWRRKWIAGPAARQVVRQNVRTAERRIDKACRVLANVKLVVKGDLADTNRGSVVEKLLLQPHIVEARRGERLDRADSQQVADGIPRQAFAAYPVPVGVERRARPLCELSEIEGERDGRAGPGKSSAALSHRWDWTAFPRRRWRREQRRHLPTACAFRPSPR